MNTAEHGNRDITKEESLTELVKELQKILKREDIENEDAIVAFNSKKFQNILTSTFRAHNLQENDVVYRAESVQAAIELFPLEIKKLLKSTPKNEMERITQLIDYFLNLRMPGGENEEPMEIWEGLEMQMRDSSTTNNYPPQLSAQFMPSFINEREFRSILMVTSSDDIARVIGNYISNIDTENIHEIEFAFIDLIITKLKHSPDTLEEVRVQLRKLITIDNVNSMERCVLDLINHGGWRGNFIRTFLPEYQGFWSKLLFYKEQGVKSIG